MNKFDRKIVENEDARDYVNDWPELKLVPIFWISKY
jgi:hypothetical protein